MLNPFKFRKKDPNIENIKKTADKTYEIELTDNKANERGYSKLLVRKENQLPEFKCKTCGMSIRPLLIDNAVYDGVYNLLLGLDEDGKTDFYPIHNLVECSDPNRLKTLYPNYKFRKVAQCRIEKQKNEFWTYTMFPNKMD